MKFNFKILSLAVAMAIDCGAVATASNVAGPDIKDLLKGAAEKIQSSKSGSQNASGSSSSTGSTILSGIKGLVEGVMSDTKLDVADIAGNWAYSEPAVAFQSDNMLKKAGGAAAAGAIEKKLAPYYEKVGLKALTITLNQDGTFQFLIRKLKLSGTFEKAAAEPNGEFVFHFKAGRVPLGKFNAHAAMVGDKLSLTFDASKLITLVNAIAKFSGKASVQAAASMLSSYDGLNCGFALTRAAAAK